MIATLNVNPALCHERNKKSAPEIFWLKKSERTSRMLSTNSLWNQPPGNLLAEVKTRQRWNGLVAAGVFSHCGGLYLYHWCSFRKFRYIFPQFYGLSLALVFAQQQNCNDKKNVVSSYCGEYSVLLLVYKTGWRYLTTALASNWQEDIEADNFPKVNA